MSSTPPSKRFKSDSPKTPRRSVIDPTHVLPGLDGVFSQLDMSIPDGAKAAAAEDGDEDEDILADTRLMPHRSALNSTARCYWMNKSACSDAVDVLASNLLPAIFNTSRDSLHDEYRKIIIENPWLVRQLFEAGKYGEYQKIRRLGMCSSQIGRPPGLI